MIETILSNETEEELKENYESIINIAINKVGEIMELKGDWEVSVSIVNPEEIRMLNSHFL